MDGSSPQSKAKAAPAITLVSGDPEEEQAGWQLLRLLQRYDLRTWQFTDAVQIDRTAIPHSTPVLTLNARYLKDDHRALATYLHEQLHWFAPGWRPEVNRAIEELRQRYPSVPPREAGGARDENSTYLHLVVCPLEYAAMIDVVGTEAARATVERADVYTWIYATVLREWDYFDDLLNRYGLALGEAPAAAALKRHEAEPPAGAGGQRAGLPWRVRPVERADAAAWEQMRQQLWPAPPGEHAAEIEYFLAGARHDPAETLIAVTEDGVPIGFAEISIRSHADGCESNGVGYLEGWFVEVPYRRRGVGAALVQAAEAWARGQGCSEFASDVEIENDVSRAAHHALGFEEVCRIVTFRKSL